MPLPDFGTDEALLQEIGARIERVRLQRNLTQAALATEAGVSKRTIERLEAGETATRLAGFLRVCRVLGLIDRVDRLIPEPAPSPMQLLQLRGRERKRASGTQVAESPRVQSPWSWGE